MALDKAPFKKQGGLWHAVPDLTQYEGQPEGKVPTLEWRTVRPWSGTMLVVGQQRGRSAAIFLLVDQKNGDSYPMFLSDATEMMKTATVVQGAVTGRWTIIKKGQNYGIKYLGSTGGAGAQNPGTLAA